MGTAKKRLQHILDGSADFPSQHFESNYQALKQMLITAKRRREGRYQINFIEAHDLAWDLADQLPDRVHLQDDPGPEQPRWRTTLIISACITALGIFAWILGYA